MWKWENKKFVWQIPFIDESIVKTITVGFNHLTPSSFSGLLRQCMPQKRLSSQAASKGAFSLRNMSLSLTEFIRLALLRLWECSSAHLSYILLFNFWNDPYLWHDTLINCAHFLPGNIGQRCVLLSSEHTLEVKRSLITYVQCMPKVYGYSLLFESAYYITLLLRKTYISIYFC